MAQWLGRDVSSPLPAPISAATPELEPEQSAASKLTESVYSFFISLTVIGGLVMAFLYFEDTRGPLLPDDVYCAMGAGISVREGASIEANAWSGSGGCGAYKPECATRWVINPATHYCMHGKLTDTLRDKFIDTPLRHPFLR